MSNVNTDGVTFEICNEDVGPPFGVITGTPLVDILEPNGISKFGAAIKTTDRAPISKNLQLLPGKTTDLDSGVSFTHDLTFEALWRCLPQMLTAKYANDPDKGPANGAALYPTGVTATEYTTTADGDLPAGTLIYASGFLKPENNGFKTVGAASTGVALKTTGLVIEALDQPAQNAKVFVCGVKGAAGDIRITAVAGVVTLVSTILDFTKLGWTEGQIIRVGGTDAGSFFDTAADNGKARIAKGGLSAHAAILDKWVTTPVTDAAGAKTIELFFGPFVSNVAIDDDLYWFVPLRVQATWPDLGGAGVPMYSQSKGNFFDQSTLEFPISSKGGMSFVLVGTDTDSPSLTPETGFDNARPAILNDSYNTSSELVRLRATTIDETGLTADFLTAQLTIKNNISPKKVLGVLGAKYMNRGRIEVTLDSSIIFTDGDVLDAVRQNTTVTCDLDFRNGDGQGFFCDLPSVKAGDGAPSFPEHDQVSLKVTFKAHRSTVYGYSVSFSLFPYLPD